VHRAAAERDVLPAAPAAPAPPPAAPAPPPRRQEGEHDEPGASASEADA
jgi:hypothetical protein